MQQSMCDAVHGCLCVQKLGDSPEELVNKWGGSTFQHLMQLYHGPDAARAGVSCVQTHYLHTEPQPPPSW
jgi:hypothetical protein